MTSVEEIVKMVQEKLGVTPRVISQPPQPQPPQQTQPTLTAKEKSAFKPSIFDPFDPYYYQPYISTVWNLLSKRHIGLPNYMVTDSFMAFYKPFDNVIENLKEPQTVWQKIISNLISSEDFVKLNRITANSAELAIAGAFRFLYSIFKKGTKSKQADEQLTKQIPKGVNEDQVVQEHLKELMSKGERPCLSNPFLLRQEDMKSIVKRVLQEVQEIKENVEEAQNIASKISGSHGFTHEALSVIHYLEKPEAFRRKVQLLRGLLHSFKFFTTAVSTSMQKATVETTYGGIIGISVLRDLKQIQDLAVQELALPESLLALRILSQQALVRQRAVSVQPVVFLDKSGSMANYLEGEITKISAGAGLALALHIKLNADVYLFDVECHKVSPKDIVKTLLTVEADSGTNITEVLKEIKRLPTTRQYIVITDGIDKVDPELAKEVAKTHKVTLCIIPPCWEEDWMRVFKVVRVRSLSDLLPSKLLSR